MYYPDPPKVLIDAVNAYVQGIAMRDADQSQKLAEETKRLAQKAGVK